MNNEPREASGNSGPADVSLPRYWPGGGGIMGYSTLYGNDNFLGDTYWRAHLVLSAYPTNPVVGAIPYLGFGAFANGGNRWPIGALNPSNAPYILKFESRLWASVLPAPCCGSGTTQLQTITSWLTIIASWGTHPKMIQIALWHQSRDPQNPSNPDPYLGGPPPQNHGVQFEWRYTQSGFYPGAVYLTLTAEEISSYCGFSVPTLVLNQDVHYSIDLQQLFQCLNDHHLFDEPLPSTANIPINTVLWANESSGINGGLWTDVHNMRMVSTPSEAQDADGEDIGKRGTGEPLSYGAKTELIRQALQSQADMAAQENR